MNSIYLNFDQTITRITGSKYGLSYIMNKLNQKLKTMK